MKKYLFFFICFLTVSSLFAQIKEITVDDLWTRWAFYPNSVYGINSMQDGENYTVFVDGSIIKYSYQTGEEVEVVLDITKLGIEYPSSEYVFNHDQTKILFYNNEESIYRRSFKANFYVYDFKTKILTPVSDAGKQQLATFSPKGDKVAFLKDNNLFIKDLTNNKETQITKDGEYNKIINGAPDWVYEEEFSYNQAYQWSPEGDFLAYVKFNESQVRMFNMTVYAGMRPFIQTNALYPENYTFKYPKAGEDNSIVTVHIYNLAKKKTLNVDLGTETDIYIPRIKWTKDNNKLCIVKLNRLQNNIELLYANPNTAATQLIYSEKNEYYMEETVYDKLEFLDNGKNFVIMSERDGYRHLYLYNIDGTLQKQLTSGEWDITDFYGHDNVNDLFYYQSAEEGAIYRAIYSVNSNSENKTKLSNMQGVNEAIFSATFKYYINYFSNHKTPNLVTLHDAKAKEIRVLEENADLKALVEEYGGVNKEFFKITTTAGIELNASVIYPMNFDKTKKYPVLITQYSGPNLQEVLDQWEFEWNNMIAQKGYLVITVDPRGTGGRGEDFRKITYMELGKYETLDLIESAKYLAKLEYVDATRIGIWGWSFGGYMALSCLTKGADYFKTAIAVAPVTNWRYYDNIYTERYMRKPQDNPKGYDDNSPINFVKNMKGKLLIVHGTSDDNVHLQNTMEFIEALVQADKQFDMQIYTNRNHSIYGGKTRKHLYTLMTNFLLENL